MAYDLEAIKQGLKKEGRDEHPENKNIHVFQHKDFIRENPAVTKFSKLEKERGYKKIFYSNPDSLSNTDKHAEAFILLDKKSQDGKNIIVCFTKIEHFIDDKNIEELEKKFSIVKNKLDQNPLQSEGCVEYATSLLQNFDGNVLLKTENGLEKTNISKVKDGQEFITEQQIKLYQSTKILEQFNINPKEFKVTDSLGRNVTLNEYTEKYKVTVPYEKITYGELKYDRNKMSFSREVIKSEIIYKEQNKKLNAETVGSRGIEGEFSPPRPNSGKDIERTHQNITKVDKEYLDKLFPGTQAKDFIEKSKNVPAEYKEFQKRADQLKQQNSQPKQKENILQKPSLNREKLKPNTLNSLSNAARNVGSAKNVEEVKTSDFKPQNRHNTPSVSTKLPAIKSHYSNSGTQQSILPKIRSR